MGLFDFLRKGKTAPAIAPSVAPVEAPTPVWSVAHDKFEASDNSTLHIANHLGETYTFLHHVNRNQSATGTGVTLHIDTHHGTIWQVKLNTSAQNGKFEVKKGTQLYDSDAKNATPAEHEAVKRKLTSFTRAHETSLHPEPARQKRLFVAIHHAMRE